MFQKKTVFLQSATINAFIKQLRTGHITKKLKPMLHSITIIIVYNIPAEILLCIVTAL